MDTAASFDLVIRGGTVFDGTGAPGRRADVAVKDGLIAAVGEVIGGGREEVDATGLIVTPGFVDIHTHYDGQAIWSTRMAPSSSHGVTTVIAGNCGVGFAPCRAEDHELLISAMEGVEDIPEVVMSAGLTWEWETFPQYLDAVASRPHDIDVGAYLPHSALRVYVMGERGARREPATADDLRRMRAISREAMEAGAMGFATSSVHVHKTIAGDFIPSYQASENELLAIAEGMREAGHGVFQMAPSPFHATEEDARGPIDILGRLSRATGVPVTFSYAQTNDHPDRWRAMLRWVEENAAGGAEVRPQLFPRPIGMIVGHALSVNPFALCPSYAELLALPFTERIAELRKPAVRARLVAEAPGDPALPILAMCRNFERMFDLTDPPDYEPSLDASIAALARKRGMTPAELAYDLLLRDDGNAMLYVALNNYADGNLDFVLEMARHPSVVLGLGDGGAHYGLICDASFPTYMLAHLTRDRAGEKIPLPDAVRALTRVPAELMGLTDRGLIAPGMKADLNVIDYARVNTRRPEVKFDLPAGGRRLDQGATGYRFTIVSGQITRRDDQPTGRLPGRLVRGGRQAAMA